MSEVDYKQLRDALLIRRGFNVSNTGQVSRRSKTKRLFNLRSKPKATSV